MLKRTERENGKRGTRLARAACGIRERLREGASSVLLYFGFCILAAIACGVFVAYAQTYSGTEHAQLMADSASDGAAFAAYEITKGWSMPYKTVRQTTEAMSFQNAVIYGLSSQSKTKRGSYSAKADKTIAEASEQVYVNTQVKESGTSGLLGDWTAKRSSRTEYAYAGGMEIVMMAYLFTKQCVVEGPNPLNLDHQTYYAWGGGRLGWHPNDDGTESMPRYADCSGFVNSVYGYCGYSIGGDTYEMGGQGTDLGSDPDDALPGDIVLFYPEGVPTHVGIYVGRNSAGTPIMIDCTSGYTGHSSDTHRDSAEYPSDGSKGVTIRPIYGNYFRFRRLITDYGEERDFPVNSDRDPAAVVFYTLMSMNGEDRNGITPKGACALMGNWYCEGGLGRAEDPGAMCEMHAGDEGYNARKLMDYDSGKYSAGAFARDYYGSYYRDNGSLYKAYGYGIGQWTSFGRKEGLFNFIKSRKGSLGDEDLQAMYAVKEIRSGSYPFTSLAINSKVLSLKAITDTVYTEFEFGLGAPNPVNIAFADIKDGSRKNREAAAEYFYNRFVKGELDLMKNGHDVRKSDILKAPETLTNPGVMQQMTYPAHVMGGATVKLKGKDGGTRKLKDGEKVLVTTRSGGVATIKLSDGKKATIDDNRLYYEGQNYDSSFEYEPDVITDFVNKKGYSSKTEYLFFCSKYNQHVYIFQGKKGEWKLIRSMKCGTGKIREGTSRDQGRSTKYEIYNKGDTTSKYAQSSNSTWYYAYKNIYQELNMHYSSPGGNSIHVGGTGQPVTHGCISLSRKNAQWCYDTLPIKTKVIVH